MHLSGNLVSILTVEFLLNWSIIDKITTHNTTVCFFGPLCMLINRI